MNLVTFTVAVIVWIALGILTALPGYTLPPSHAFLFATLTGVVLTIVQGFEKGVTFSSTTETASSTTTTTATSPAETGIPASPPGTTPKDQPE